VFLRPDRKGTTRAVLTLQGPSGGEDRLTPDEQKAFLTERFADAGWETPRVLEGLAASDDFYFEVLRQVRLARWSSGRVVLTGDAAWCVTPLGGLGASLALVGAYVLAGELSGTQDVGEALAAYERILRPYVEQAQHVPKAGPRMAQPHSRFGVALQRALLGVAAAPGVRQVVSKLLTPADDKLDLPDYGARSRQA
ncbi:MAG TPA: FAD-dependent monooxygenase, partial [Polyangiaceae bacterium]|nr:FAD-dependent monooxygenase [Polyangiaceae bacterium]